MSKSAKIKTLAVSREIPFNQLVLSQANVRRLKPEEFTDRYLDTLAKIAALKDDDEGALKGWYAALDRFLDGLETPSREEPTR